MILIINTSFQTITLPIRNITPGRSITIDWGDTTTSTVTTENPSHYYGNGFYTITITGSQPDAFKEYGDPIQADTNNRDTLRQISSFGNLELTSIIFNGFRLLTVVPSNIPSTITNLSNAFANCTIFNSTNITSWNVSNVTNMSGMFDNCRDFNQNIGGWITNNVTNMSLMFRNAINFNQDIGGWTTNNVTNMVGMFNNARSFNQNISGWNVSKVTNMINMFNGAFRFNQNISLASHIRIDCIFFSTL